MTAAKSLLHRLLPPAQALTAADVLPARDYIKKYWANLERFHPSDDGTLVGLPQPYLVPAYEEGHEFDFNELYYWDSYFMVQGMLDEAHREFVLGILDDLLFEFTKFKVIPNASRAYFIGHSQPPFLTSFIFDVYDAYKLDNDWLKAKLQVAEAEYLTVWMASRNPHWRRVHKDLSRYYDVNVLHDLAEAESGWDMTPRFGRKCLNFVPVDLNAMLYKYETDFARGATILDDQRAAKMWNEKAELRLQTMNRLMWDRLRGFYFDYNYVKHRRGPVWSLAGYFPMWAGMVSDHQAQVLVKNLRRFEERGGLATTDAQLLNQFLPGPLPMQWAHPNGWAPLHLIVVKALERYGYHAEARRIVLKWLRTNLNWFNKNGVFLEKYNVVQPSKPPAKGLYPSQTGFGWTNAVFERFCQDYVDKG